MGTTRHGVFTRSFFAAPIVAGHLLLGLGVGTAFAFSTPVLAQADQVAAPKKCRPRRGRFHFQFEEASVFDVLKTISVLKCRNFIVSEGIKGAKKELTIISRKKVSVNQAYAAFLSALEANNMALVPAGNFLKLVERKDAARQALPMYERKSDGSIGRVDLPSAISYSDAHVTFVHELQYASKDQVQPLLRNLTSKTADIQFVGANLMIITDSASNIRRLMAILQRIDIAGLGNRMHVVNIYEADAAQVSTKLQEIFGETSIRPQKSPNPDGSQGAATIEEIALEKIIVDERTNKLIIIASDRAFRHIKEMIDILDVPSEVASTEVQVFVHPLNNADAQKISGTLSSLAQGSNKSRGKSKKKKSTDPATLFEGEVKITADEATNALVITASPRDYRSLQRVVDELDVRRPQVFVEAAILEVALNKDRQFGIDAYSGLPLTVPGFDGQGLGVVGNEGGQRLISSSAQLLAAQSLFQNLNSNNIDPSALGTAAEAAGSLENLLGWMSIQGPAVPGSEDAFGFPIPSFGMVLNALENNASVDVLSTPHIMTTDNEKAEISVGQRIPVVRGISPVGGGGGLGFGGLQQVAYEDVKLKFVVTPHVNDGGEVRIELEQEVSDLGGNIPVGNGLTQPIITNRSANTTVVVKDQQTVVIGGLISNRGTDSERKFPILGDVPVIGWLFKQWSDDDQKTNLIIVMTPYIVRSEVDFKKIYERKMKERRDFIEAYYGTAREFNPYIDYDKKSGPLGKLFGTLEHELTKVENGGPGLPGEKLITPESITPFGIDEDSEDDGGEGEESGDDPEGSGDTESDGAVAAPVGASEDNPIGDEGDAIGPDGTGEDE